MRKLLPQIDSSLKDFFNQLYLLAQPFKHCEKTMGRMKKLMVFLCYLLALLNNSKINFFKFDLAYYLDSVGTSNEGLNTLASIGITTTARAVNNKKRQCSEAHREFVEKVLENRSESTFVLNVDDYHNVHVPWQPDTTSTSWAVHIATIIANPCPISTIPRNGVINLKIVDDELILKHLDERFIENLGISYHVRRRNYMGKCSDNKVIERLTLHSYDDRLAEKKNDKHIQNVILLDFTESNLKGIKDYTKALQVVYNQKPMQEYLSNNAIPIVADWPGQFFIRKAIAHRLLLNNEAILSFVSAFVPMMGPLHVSLYGRKLIFLKNSCLFNDVYKGIFGPNKDLGKKPQPWRIDLILHVMHMAWLDIADIVFSKFGHTCKNIEYLYLTDLLSNLISLVLDVCAIHHQEGNWQCKDKVSNSVKTT